MIEIYYGSKLTVKNIIKTANGELANQSFPFPKIQITHTSVTSNITITNKDWDDSLESKLGDGYYQTIIPSYIFSSSIDNYQFKITAQVADEYFTSSFTVYNSTDATTVGITDVIEKNITQFQTFYRDNFKKFFPEVEQELMNENQKYNLLIEGIGNFFDKIDQIIENIVTLTRIDEIPDEYLRYISQIVGYETDDFTISNIALRSIISEIFTIYNLRGTVSGFEKFFKAIGYNTEIREKWYVGALKVNEQKPFVDYVGSSVGEPWKYSSLLGVEKSYIYDAYSHIYGSLDVIRTSDDEIRFVEMYPTSIYSYNLDPSTRFQAVGKYSKSERLINLIVESIKDTELIPDIIDQMITYIEFLKPVHLKLILTLLKEFEDAWWQESDRFETVYDTYTYQKYDADNNLSTVTEDLYLDGTHQLYGNVPREIDSVLFGIRYEDQMSGIESNIIKIDAAFSSPYHYDSLTMNGDWYLHDTQFSDFRLDSNIWEFGDAGGIIVKRVTGSYPYHLNSVIGSVAITMNEKLPYYNTSAVIWPLNLPT
jgi:hypothetical protein